MADTQKNCMCQDKVTQVGGVFGKRAVSGGSRMMNGSDVDPDDEVINDADVMTIKELRVLIDLCLLLT